VEQERLAIERERITANTQIEAARLGAKTIMDKQKLEDVKSMTGFKSSMDTINRAKDREAAAATAAARPQGGISK
jgi:hypothetical protein